MNISISNPVCYSSIGQKPNQEDSLFPLEGKADAGQRVFMVCDGMGGHENGEVASACVAETIGNITSASPACTVAEMKAVFEYALEQAYHNLDALDKNESQKKMGTTLTFLALCNDGILTAHIGDSRIYQFRPGSGIVFQTRDHSLVSELIAAGELTQIQAKSFPQRNVITRAIQPHQEYPAKPTYNVLTDIQKGDVFMLCCDGVVEQLDDDDLTSIILSKDTLDDKLQQIKNECAARNTRDNNTCYLVEIREVKGVIVENNVTCRKADEVTVTPVHAEKRNYKVWIGVFLLAVLAVLLFAFFSGDEKEPIIDEPQTECAPVDVDTAGQVQGTIQRHSKK